jgi:hypothetical protein
MKSVNRRVRRCVSAGGAARLCRSLGVALCVIGCYHYRITPARSVPADDGHSATMHSLFWGLVQSEAREPECQGNGAAEVVATTNLGYTLLAVVTLGIWSPLELTWRCAKDRLRVDTGLD